MSKTRLLVVVVLAAAFGAFPPSAGAADVFQFSGKFAEAHFITSDVTGCEATEVLVASAVDERSHQPPGGLVAASRLFLAVQRSNICIGGASFIAVASPSLDQDDLQIADSLDSATLRTTVATSDLISGKPVTFTIDLAWPATEGRVFREVSHSLYQTGGASILSGHTIGTFQPAQAIGTVSDGSTNYTSTAADRAGIGSVKFGTIVVSDPSALLATTFSAPTSSNDAQRLTVDRAEAGFFPMDASGCVASTLIVGASDLTSQQLHGKPEGSSELQLILQRYDVCANESLSSVFVQEPLQADDFSVSRTLEGATVEKEITTTDQISGAPITLAVNLSWTGIGELTRGIGGGHAQSTDGIFNSAGTFLLRNAQIAGEVSDGVRNFVSGPPAFASISRGLTHETTIG